MMLTPITIEEEQEANVIATLIVKNNEVILRLAKNRNGNLGEHTYESLDDCAEDLKFILNI